ncbi:OB-fold domain-containing protein [Mycobacterium sp. CVI_P3]|uniref:OB-fold domain-containing protein n=1 Tax=Mycobacterium pinniadriaticum TaxID=2994102 RepID=A0ABT3SC04_9MYCO|nr:OB-fold domain-containing protein [Mycobacterium pinniadriaticum]MCX2930626.1 OB-fold domain-containing protein [Mycobacterium pinniadriaticum]MCX2937050.1 OB-fold domain-containing protein [Mycobacterium pinniadriaticum]
MTTAGVTSDVVPVAEYLVLGPEPHVTGFRCHGCGAVYLLRRSACSRCGRAEFDRRENLGDSGVVTVATVVHRAPPGVVTPFVSGVVALDGGGYVRTNLTGAVEDPVATIGRRAVMRTRPIGTDSRGVAAIGYDFEVQVS